MRLWYFALLAVAGVAAPAVATPLFKEEMIPMRDGIRLSATVALPAGPGPFPAILTRTPYALPASPSNYVEAGYAVVQQNLRGLFKSEGKWANFQTEIADGYDTVEWIAAQSWSNGKVGVLGSSGPGIAGYMALMSGAPHLSAGVIQNAHASGYSTATFPGGVYQAGLVDSWLEARGATIPPLFPRPVFRRYDTEAQQIDVRTHAANIRVPILHYTGWFDIFTQGTIDYFHLAQTHGSEKAPGNQKLIVHPKGHSGQLPGELQWETEMFSFPGLSRRWFDYWLRDIDTGIQKQPPVQYYMLGDPRKPGAPGNSWRAGASWPPIHHSESFYLLPGGGLSRTAPTQKTASSSFDYEPLDPVPSLTAKPDDWLNRAPVDQRPLQPRADILRFTSLPRPQDVEIAGQVEAELYVSTTAKDTDFFVRFLDIHPDGYEAVMLSQPLRLRFREGFDKMLPVRQNRVYKIRVNLWSIAMILPKGHRIGVHITSSDSPRFDRHSNTWEPVKDYDEAVNATNTVYHSARYPSRLILPLRGRGRQ